MEDSKKGSGMTAEKSKALAPRCADREAVRQGSIMREGRHPGRLHRLAGPGHRAGRRRPAARPRGRNLRSGIVGQDHADAAGHRRDAEARRHCAFIDAEHALDVSTRRSSA
jgi:hypothetical protein